MNAHSSSNTEMFWLPPAAVAKLLGMAVMVDIERRESDAVLRDLGLALEQRRALDDAPDHGEDTADALFLIVRANRRLRIAATEQQQGVSVREFPQTSSCLTFLGTRVNLLRVQKATIVVALEGVLEKGAFGWQELEWLLGLWVVGERSR